MKNRIGIIITALGLVVGANTQAAAYRHTSLRHEKTVTQRTQVENGVIESIDNAGRSFTLRHLQTGKQDSFVWDATTKVVNRGEMTGPTTLKSGERVTVHFMKNGLRRHANEIQIDQKKAA